MHIIHQIYGLVNRLLPTWNENGENYSITVMLLPLM